MSSITPAITATTGPPQHPEPIVIVAYVCFAVGGLLILGGIIRLLVWACSSPSEEKSRVNFYSNKRREIGVNSKPEMTETRKRDSSYLEEHVQGEHRNYTFAKPVDTSDEINGGSETSRTESQVHDVSSGRGSNGNDSVDGDTDLVSILVHQLRQDISPKRARNLHHELPPVSESRITSQKVHSEAVSVDGNITSPTSNNAWSGSDKLAGDKYMTLRNQHVSASPRMHKDNHFVSEVHMIVNDNRYVQIDEDSPESNTLYISRADTNEPEESNIPRTIIISDRDEIYIPRSSSSDSDEGYFHYADQLDHDISLEYEDNKRQLASVIQVPMATDRPVILS